MILSSSPFAAHKFHHHIMKLTNSILEESPRVLNPCKQLTLLLRNLDLSDVDLLPNTFEAVDLSNNQLIDISLPRACEEITTLIINNNPELYQVNYQSFPRLKSLAVINCNIKLDQAIEWKGFQHLKHLVVLNNPITTVERYRLILIHLIPSLTTLDFEKVNQRERTAASELFETTSVDDLLKGVYKSTDTRELLIQRLKTTKDINEIEHIERLLA